MKSSLRSAVIALITLVIIVLLALRIKKQTQVTSTAPVDTEVTTVFQNHCAQCHGADGGGAVGPNLTDDFWISGNTLEAVKKSIEDGNPERGMPAYKNQLKDEQISALVGYIASLQGSQPQNAKAPQGFGQKLIK